MIVNFDKYEDLSKFKDMLIPKKFKVYIASKKYNL